MTNQYNKEGYFVVEGLLSESNILRISKVVDKFHDSWRKENYDFYKDKAVNSAYLTGKQHLNDSDRTILFECISSEAITNIVLSLPFAKPAFMNTQLFFNPVNPEQKNYWHRDPQYHLTIDEQKQALLAPEVIHFRIALENEPGVELIPGTHRRWDTDEELNKRLELSGNKNHEDISTGQTIPLNKGDLLVFSANMIHRGLYGGNRKALDILFCEATPELLKFAHNDCMPDNKILEKLNKLEIFTNAINIISQPDD